MLGGVRDALLDGGQDAGDIGDRPTRKGEGLRRTTSPTPGAGCGIVASSRLRTRPANAAWPEDLVALDEALDKLAASDKRTPVRTHTLSRTRRNSRAFSVARQLQ